MPDVITPEERRLIDGFIWRKGERNIRYPTGSSEDPDSPNYVEPKKRTPGFKFIGQPAAMTKRHGRRRALYRRLMLVEKMTKEQIAHEMGVKVETVEHMARQLKIKMRVAAGTVRGSPAREAPRRKK